MWWGKPAMYSGVSSAWISGRAYSKNSSVIWVWFSFIQLSGTFFSRFATSLMGCSSVVHWYGLLEMRFRATIWPVTPSKAALAAAPPT